jgi:hypothetical protein
MIMITGIVIAAIVIYALYRLGQMNEQQRKITGEE